MTRAPKPWPGPGDPRHETAVEAGTIALVGSRRAWGVTPTPARDFKRERASDVIAAYLRSLAEQGVVLVGRQDPPEAPCATCGGSGQAIAPTFYPLLVACPHCEAGAVACPYCEATP